MQLQLQCHGCNNTIIQFMNNIVSKNYFFNVFEKQVGMVTLALNRFYNKISDSYDFDTSDMDIKGLTYFFLIVSI